MYLNNRFLVSGGLTDPLSMPGQNSAKTRKCAVFEVTKVILEFCTNPVRKKIMVGKGVEV